MSCCWSGPSFLQRLTAAWSELMLPKAEREWSVEEWAAALGEEEPELPARDARREKERQREREEDAESDEHDNQDKTEL